MNRLELITGSVEETVRLGEMIGELLQPGDFVALTGDLGAGKTHLTKGIALGVGVADSTSVTSPTYTLLNVHQGRHVLNHFDLYRLSGDDDVVNLGFYEYFYGSGISIVEWADRLQDELPAEHLAVRLLDESDNRRRVVVEGIGERYRFLMSDLTEKIGTQPAFSAMVDGKHGKNV